MKKKWSTSKKKKKIVKFFVGCAATPTGMLLGFGVVRKYKFPKCVEGVGCAATSTGMLLGFGVVCKYKFPK